MCVCVCVCVYCVVCVCVLCVCVCVYCVVCVCVLQDSPLTNAGVGSNLSLHGTVECDASLMDGAGGFGSIGAVQGR